MRAVLVATCPIEMPSCDWNACDWPGDVSYTNHRSLSSKTNARKNWRKKEKRQKESIDMPIIQSKTIHKLYCVKKKRNRTKERDSREVYISFHFHYHSIFINKTAVNVGFLFSCEKNAFFLPRMNLIYQLQLFHFI